MYRAEWAAAVAKTLQYIKEDNSDNVRLERGLKWHLCLHDVLLRGPRRGTRGARANANNHFAVRFQAWRDGRVEEWIYVPI